MITTETTPEMVAAWKKIFETHHDDMQPNRKTGTEVDAYFRKKYAFHQFDSNEFRKIVEFNIMENEYSRKKLPEGISPKINSYCKDDVLVGIDLISGEFHIECDDINKVISLYDDLFVYRGLDKEDLKNFFLVVEYVNLTGR